MLISIRLLLFLVAALMLQACVVPPTLAVPEQIIRALQTRHYADAMRAARQGQASLAALFFTGLSQGEMQLIAPMERCTVVGLVLETATPMLQLV